MKRNIRNEQTQQIADDLIEAAQALEAEAKRLKLAAKVIRAEGLTQWTDEDPIEMQRMHKHYDIESACVKAKTVIHYAN